MIDVLFTAVSTVVFVTHNSKRRSKPRCISVGMEFRKRIDVI